MTMDLRHIRYFVALYEERSVTRAAARLNVVQPAVSTQIRNLEREHEVVLFERTPQGVFPTAIAQSMYSVCLGVLASLSSLDELLTNASGKVAGVLSIGVPPSMAQGVLSEYLSIYSKLSPNVQIRCYEGYSGHLIEWLSQGIVDFAIVNSEPSDLRINARHLWSEDLVVVHERGKHVCEKDFSASQLGSFRLILPTVGNFLRTMIDSNLGHLGAAVVPALEIDSLTAVLQMVKRPGWASIVPRMALRGSRETEGLVARKLIEPVIRRSLLVAFHQARAPSLAAQGFILGLERLLHQPPEPTIPASSTAAHGQ